MRLMTLALSAAASFAFVHPLAARLILAVTVVTIMGVVALGLEAMAHASIANPTAFFLGGAASVAIWLALNS
jgi:hypothetical protein